VSIGLSKNKKTKTVEKKIEEKQKIWRKRERLKRGERVERG